MPRRLILVAALFLAPLFLLTDAVAQEWMEGTVNDFFTGDSLAGATVTCGGIVAKTEEDGRYRLPEGCGEELTARAPGYRRRTQSAEALSQVRLTPFTPRALYLSFYGAGSSLLRGRALELIEQTRLNAVVIDVKGDRGLLSYRSALPLATEIGAQEIITLRDLPGLLESLQDRGVYTIARIVVFKDDLLAQKYPELAVRNSQGEIWRDGEGLAWADPFRKEVWDYNVAIAEEAARAGFDEIQFDYVRFPDRRGLVFSDEIEDEAKRVGAISGFLAEARAKLDPLNVFTSADIFGYVCWNRNDTHIGQHLESLAPHVDYLAPMLYPSGFQYGVGEYRNPVKHPGQIIGLSLQAAQKRTGIDPVRFRPWLQAFRDYAFDRRHFDAKEIRAQVLAADEFGSNGWMLWNARNVYSAAGLDAGYEMRAEIESETRIR